MHFMYSLYSMICYKDLIDLHYTLSEFNHTFCSYKYHKNMQFDADVDILPSELHILTISKY